MVWWCSGQIGWGLSIMGVEGRVVVGVEVLRGAPATRGVEDAVVGVGAGGVVAELGLERLGERVRGEEAMIVTGLGGRNGLPFGLIGEKEKVAALSCNWPASETKGGLRRVAGAWSEDGGARGRLL